MMLRAMAVSTTVSGRPMNPYSESPRVSEWARVKRVSWKSRSAGFLVRKNRAKMKRM